MGHWGLQNDRTGCGKAMETLPGPKTVIKKSKIQKIIEKFKNLNFRIFPMEELGTTRSCMCDEARLPRVATEQQKQENNVKQSDGRGFH